MYLNVNISGALRDILLCLTLTKTKETIDLEFMINFEWNVFLKK